LDPSSVDESNGGAVGAVRGKATIAGTVWPWARCICDAEPRPRRVQKAGNEQMPTGLEC
jgi:hypothetical protein